MQSSPFSIKLEDGLLVFYAVFFYIIECHCLEEVLHDAARSAWAAVQDDTGVVSWCFLSYSFGLLIVKNQETHSRVILSITERERSDKRRTSSKQCHSII